MYNTYDCVDDVILCYALCLNFSSYLLSVQLGVLNFKQRLLATWIFIIIIITFKYLVVNVCKPCLTSQELVLVRVDILINPVISLSEFTVWATII